MVKKEVKFKSAAASGRASPPRIAKPNAEFPAKASPRLYMIKQKMPVPSADVSAKASPKRRVKKKKRSSELGLK